MVAVDTQMKSREEQGLGAVVVYWLLLGMGLLVLAPCVLLPEWRSYEALRAAQQVEEHRVAAMEDCVALEERKLEALRSDPATVERLARRDLAYYRPDEIEVPVDTVSVIEPSPEPLLITPVVLPPRVALVVAWLPRYNYDAIFCEPESRRIMIGLSVALLGTAFLLFARRPALRAS